VRIEEVEGEEVDTGGVAGTDLDEVCEAISGGLASLEAYVQFPTPSIFAGPGSAREYGKL
jgi:hypothetical protein